MTVTDPPVRQTMDIEAMGWDRFRRWFRDRWQIGEHIALIGPTGMGKTTLACGILPLRKYVLALDAKGGDSTLGSLTRCGFRRTATWPPDRSARKAMEDGEPVRLIVGVPLRTKNYRTRQIDLFRRVLDDVRENGTWTVYIDELQVMADPRLMKLAGPIEENLTTGRDLGLSIVTSYQRPANVPRSASDQARWLMVWYTRDVDVVNRLAEMAGRPKSEIRGAVAGLQKYSILLFSSDPTEPVRVIRPPRT